MNEMRIKGPRQRRAIEALLSGPVSVKDLGTPDWSFESKAGYLRTPESRV